MSRLRAIALSDFVDSDTDHLLPSWVCNDLKRNENGWPGCTPQQVAAVRLRLSLLKKHADDVHPDADQRALKKFLAVNEQCSRWTLDGQRSLVEDTLLGEVRSWLYWFWHHRSSNGVSTLVDSPSVLLDEGSMGPGASYGADGDDFYTKLFAGPLTCTSELLYRTYTAWCFYRPIWASAEQVRQLRHGSASQVKQNRLAFVPKSNDISRTICIEPSLNMYYQLGLKRILSRRLRALTGIDLEPGQTGRNQQDVNRELARRGSIDGSLATIDLSSASDSISVKMLENICPPAMVRLLMLLRTPGCELPNGEVVPLHMVSTMGNGFTFPLQTLIFTSCVLAVYKLKGITPVSGHEGNFGVYGDDIICEASCYAAVTRLLGILGFSVNSDKSFHEGLFRESCGADWYGGYPVRGFYLRDQNDPTAPYVAYNRLTEWCAKTHVWLPSTLRYLLRCGKFLPVPWCESEAAGYKVTLRSIRAKRDANGSFAYQRLEPKASHLKFLEDGVTTPKWRGRLGFNPDGALLCFLSGYIVSGKLAVRTNGLQAYRQRRAVSPRHWEWTASEAANAADLARLRAARDFSF